jgi:hypothetical protein
MDDRGTRAGADWARRLCRCSSANVVRLRWYMAHPCMAGLPRAAPSSPPSFPVSGIPGGFLLGSTSTTLVLVGLGFVLGDLAILTCLAGTASSMPAAGQGNALGITTRWARFSTGHLGHLTLVEGLFFDLDRSGQV